MQVIVYTTTTCPFCRMLEDYLKGKSIPFEEKVVDRDGEARKEMMTHSDGFLGVPFTVIQKDDGGVEKILGFDKGKLNKILGL